MTFLSDIFNLNCNLYFYINQCQYLINFNLHYQGLLTAGSSQSTETLGILQDFFVLHFTLKRSGKIQRMEKLMEHVVLLLTYYFFHLIKMSPLFPYTGNKFNQNL